LNINQPPPAVTKEHTKGIFYGYVIAIAAFFILLAGYGVRFTYGVFFDPMANDLGWSSATTSAAFSISMILEGIFSFIMGGMTDRFGPRIVLTVSALIVGLGYGLIPLTHSVWQFYIFYGMLVGIGMGGMFVPLVAIIARWFSARRSLMTGLVSSGTGIGMIVISPLAARLIIGYGWRTTFVIMGISILVITIIAAQFLKRDPSTMGLLPYGEKSSAQSLASPENSQKNIPGFSFQEAIRTRQFWIIFLMVLWFGFYSTSFNVHIVPDAIKSGMPSLTAASILPVSGAILISGRIGMGMAGDRIGNRRIFLIGFAISTLALCWLVINQYMWSFFLVGAMIGFSSGGVGTAQSPLAASIFGLKSHGLIYGLIGLGFTLGAGLGPLVTGFIVDWTHSYQIAFVVGIAASMAALAFAQRLKPTRNSPVKKVKF
jgi:MFS family permease